MSEDYSLSLSSSNDGEEKNLRQHELKPKSSKVKFQEPDILSADFADNFKMLLDIKQTKNKNGANYLRPRKLSPNGSNLRSACSSAHNQNGSRNRRGRNSSMPLNDAMRDRKPSEDIVSDLIRGKRTRQQGYNKQYRDQQYDRELTSIVEGASSKGGGSRTNLPLARSNLHRLNTQVNLKRLARTKSIKVPRRMETTGTSNADFERASEFKSQGTFMRNPSNKSLKKFRNIVNNSVIKESSQDQMASTSNSKLLDQMMLMKPNISNKKRLKRTQTEAVNKLSSKSQINNQMNNDYTHNLRKMTNPAPGWDPSNKLPQIDNIDESEETSFKTDFQKQSLGQYDQSEEQASTSVIQATSVSASEQVYIQQLKKLKQAAKQGYEMSEGAGGTISENAQIQQIDHTSIQKEVSLFSPLLTQKDAHPEDINDFKIKDQEQMVQGGNLQGSPNKLSSSQMSAQKRNRGIGSDKSSRFLDLKSNSKSEVRLQCAREQRLLTTFEQKKEIVTNLFREPAQTQYFLQDAMKELKARGIEPDLTYMTEKDQQMIYGQKVPKLHNILVQPTSVFDFKDSLRRPVSAKIKQIKQRQRQKKIEEEDQRKMVAEYELDQIRKQLLKDQVQKLSLDMYQFDKPLANSGVQGAGIYRQGVSGGSALGSEEKDSMQHDESFAEHDAKSNAKSSKSKSKSKSKKSKVVKEEVKVLTAEEKIELELQEIQLRKEERKLANLYPEPTTKIFFSQRSKRQKSKQSQMQTSSKGTNKRKDITSDASSRNHGDLASMSNQQNLQQQQIMSASQSRQSFSTNFQHPSIQQLQNRQLSTISKKSDSVSSNLKISVNLSKARLSLNRDLNVGSHLQELQTSGTTTQINPNHNLGDTNQVALSKMKSSVAQRNLDKQKSLLGVGNNQRGTQLIGLQRGANQFKSMLTQQQNRGEGGQYQESEGGFTSQIKQTKSLVQRKMSQVQSQIKESHQQRFAGKSQPRIQIQLDKLSLQNRSTKRKGSSRDSARSISQKVDGELKNLLKVQKKKSLTWSKEEQHKRANPRKKPDPSYWMRKNPKPFKEELQNMDLNLNSQMKEIKKQRLYDVQDIQKELEELTEDEDEIKQHSPKAQAIWEVKRHIKVGFKRYMCPPVTTLNFYKIGRVLGKGAFGKVNLAIHKLSNKMCAVKSISTKKTSIESAWMRLKNEIFLLKHTRHPSIVKLFEALDSDGHHLMFMELCTGGDLLQFVRRRRRLPEAMAKYFMRQVMTAIGYCHLKCIVHRDIKLENVLLNNLGQIKLCDFGVSKLVTDEEIEKQCIKESCGTPAYMAPEVVETGNFQEFKNKQQQGGKSKKKDGFKGKKAYGKQCDIWSAGVLLFAMIYGTLPFKGASVREIKEKIVNGKFQLKETVSEEARDLLSGMLQRDVEKRLTVDEVLQAAWFDGTPDPDEVRVFNQSEKALMAKEYFYAENPSYWDKQIEMSANEMDEALFFKTELLNSVEEEGLANESDISAILAPFNSTESEGKGVQDENFLNEVTSMDLLKIKEEQILFGPKALRADITYERSHNRNIDNGVYMDDVDHSDLAKMMGANAEEIASGMNSTMRKEQQRAQLERAKTCMTDSQAFVDATKENEPEVEATYDAKHQERFKFDPLKDYSIGKIDERGNLVRDEDFNDAEGQDANNQTSGERKNNKFCPPFEIKGDVVFMVCRFGYPKEHIMESLVKNEANHVATTYYLLDEDHTRIN